MRRHRVHSDVTVMCVMHPVVRPIAIPCLYNKVIYRSDLRLLWYDHLYSMKNWNRCIGKSGILHSKRPVNNALFCCWFCFVVVLYWSMWDAQQPLSSSGILFINSDWMYYNDVIMDTIAFQITSLTIVYSTVYSDADQRNHQSSASLAFKPVNSPHKWPVTRKMFPFDDAIMDIYICVSKLGHDWFRSWLETSMKTRPSFKKFSFEILSVKWLPFLSVAMCSTCSYLLHIIVTIYQRLWKLSRLLNSIQ